MIITIDAKGVFCSDNLEPPFAESEAEGLAYRLLDCYPELEEVTDVDVSGEYLSSGIWRSAVITITCTGDSKLHDIDSFLIAECGGWYKEPYSLIDTE